MKKNGQHKSNGATLTQEQLSIALQRDNAAFAAGFRECYGLLTVIVNELPTDTRIKYIDKLQELFNKLRSAEKSAGKGL